MSRYSRIIPALLLIAAFCQPALAVDQATRAEIVYRANLGRADDVKLLVSQGANPNQTDSAGVPVIALAAVRADAEGINVIKALLELGANINAADPKGQNALFYAAKAGNVEVAKFLLAHKADGQAIDAEGNTARAEAVKAGHTNVADAIDEFAAKQTVEVVPLTATAPAAIAPEVIATPVMAASQPAVREPFEIDEKKLEQSAMPKAPVAATSPAVVETAAKPAMDEKRQGEVRQLSYEIAWHTCAFQYWAYCQQVKQSTELTQEELSIAVETQKDATEALEKKLLVDYDQPESSYDAITSSAQVRIYNQLNTMGSNRARHENGIGKMDDMQNRCEEIGRQWDFPAPAKADAPVSSGKSPPLANKPHH